MFFFSRASVEPLKLFLVGFRVQAILADVPQPLFDRFAWNDKKRHIQEECDEEHILANVWKREKNPPLQNPARLGMHKDHHTEFSENSGFSPQIIHFNRVFHYFHHPFWGIPIFGNSHTFTKYSPFQLASTAPDLCPIRSWPAIDSAEGVQKL